MVNYIAQAVGFGGAALNCISFQQNKRSRIIGVQIFAAIMFIIHFIMLGAYTGAALNFIGLLRSIVFYNSDKKWAKSPVWLVVFIIISAVSSILTWKEWYSILPATAMILTTISYWMKDETKIRLITFPSSPCWLIYNVFEKSVAGIVTECIVMTSLIIAIVRYDILKKKKVKTDEN